MNNNIGTTTILLPRTIGDTLDFDDPLELNSIAIIAGELSLGFILFDANGTMSVCSSITEDTSGNPIYSFKTTTLNTEIDINNLLSQSY